MRIPLFCDAQGDQQAKEDVLHEEASAEFNRAIAPHLAAFDSLAVHYAAGIAWGHRKVCMVRSKGP